VKSATRRAWRVARVKRDKSVQGRRNVRSTENTAEQECDGPD